MASRALPLHFGGAKLAAQGIGSPSTRSTYSARPAIGHGVSRLVAAPSKQQARPGNQQRTVMVRAKQAGEHLNSNEPYEKLQKAEAWLVSEQRKMPVASLWGEQPDRARVVLVAARSMGLCGEGQLQGTVVQKLRDADVTLLFLTIGPPERGREFSKLTGFPEDQLIADPDYAVYKQIEFKNSLFATFFNPQTPWSILARIRKNGAKELRSALGDWKAWIPTAKGGATQQGGTLTFKGRTAVWQYKDPSTGAHATPETILEQGLALTR